MRIYIAGPMTGIPEFNYPAFHAAAAAWRAHGWDAVCPAEEFSGDTTMPYRAYVERDIERLRSVDAVAMLEGWDAPGSRGAVWEREIALRVFHLPVFEGVEPFPASLFELPTILEEALRLVHGDRGADYGHPIEDYTRTGRMWGAILGIPDIDPRLCCLMMAAMKLSRERNKHKRDNLTDLAGYAECAQMIAERQATP